MSSTRIAVSSEEVVCVAWGEVTTLPGCDMVAVSHGSAVLPRARGQGYGTQLHELKLTHMHIAGYDYAICTVVSTNDAERHILASHGWRKLDQFKSSKTENTVEIWGRLVGDLTEGGIVK